MDGFLQAATLLFVLLNPFLLSVYLNNLVRELTLPVFAGVLFRAIVISGIVYFLCAWLGERIFTEVFRARFAAFLLFGGIVFLMIGIQYVFQGVQGIAMLRGDPRHLSGSIAMPFMIGPGTVSAAVLAGSQIGPARSALAIALALAASFASMLAYKQVHDKVRQRFEPLVERYIEIAGRVAALFTGTYAVEMILQGLELWLGLGLGKG